MANKYLYLIIVGMVIFCGNTFSQEMQTVRPAESSEVLLNPGVGFMTFQRFNGDKLNSLSENDNGYNWTEGYPIKYQEFNGSLENINHPQTTIAYFRVYWKFIEPEKDKYNWGMIDKALLTAKQRGQTLILRIAPHGTDLKEDIPDWLRKSIGESKDLRHDYWLVDPEDEQYTSNWTNLIRDLGARYNGNPALEGVDMALIGAWGEGAGSEMLTNKTIKVLTDAYLETFTNTNLIQLLIGPKTNSYGLSKQATGWRIDCLGDMGFWRNPPDAEEYWCHMLDEYPQMINHCNMQDAWKKAPVTFEVCGVMNDWLEKGFDIDYIIEQSLKWHMSSFNAKSSPIPKQWESIVDEWLKKMGYRFVLRRFSCPKELKVNKKLEFTTWWENKGVAPCYKQYPLAIRLTNNKNTEVFVLDVDIRDWLPGDILYNNAIVLPSDMPKGEYNIDIGIINPDTQIPIVKLANKGQTKDGWYRLTQIKITK